MTMSAQTMILRDSSGNEAVVPLGPSAKRERGDCVLGGNVAINTPVWVEILLHADGSWEHWATRWQDKQNTYLHIQHEYLYPQEKQPPATEEQRRTVARWWLGIDARPYGIALGQSACAWAFDGLTPNEISSRYGDGRAVVLAGGPEADLPEPEDRTPYHKGDNDA